MSREILFRGKRLNNGEWVCGNLIQMDSEGSQSFIFPFYKYASSLTCAQIVSMFMVAVDSTTVGQFTGLCDDKRRKVFEGDIIDVRGRFKSEVRYVSHNAGYLVKDNYGDWKWLYDVLASMFCEVIGNIHDNPELVKEEEAE